jgi:hypothetical protein
MGFIGGFYKVEAEAKARELTGARLLAHRQAHAAPLAEDFRAWLTEHIDDLNLKTHPVRKAMQYYINHWAALTRFLTDPLVELDKDQYSHCTSSAETRSSPAWTAREQRYIRSFRSLTAQVSMLPLAA